MNREHSRKRSFNPEIHPRCRYFNNPPDFSFLASKYPSFAPFVYTSQQGTPTIDFKNPDAVRELTYCLLKNDFDIELFIPKNSLCPMITNRLNYLHWLEDLLQVYEDPNQSIVGLDVGTGASCIYPLLGCRLHPTWKFVATDISPQSISFAKDNITRNNLADKIHLYLNPDSQITLPINEIKIASENSKSSIPVLLDFTMCNPPFYSSEQHMVDSQTAKKGDAFAACTGASHEMITAGGEYQFVKNMILESEKYGSQVRWFTSMIGIKETLNKLIPELQRINVKSYTTTTFRQGYTLRWALAWSYTEEVPDDLKISTQNKRRRMEKSLSSPNRQLLSTNFNASMGFVSTELQSIMDELEIVYSVLKSNHGKIKLEGRVYKNTWSRRARRARMKSKTENDKESTTSHQTTERKADSGKDTKECVEGKSQTKQEENDQQPDKVLFAILVNLQSLKQGRPDNADTTSLTFSLVDHIADLPTKEQITLFQSLYDHIVRRINASIK